MKKTKLLSLLALTACLSACGKYVYPTFGPLPEGESYKVGILLPVEHDALNAAADGFVQGLAASDWTEGTCIQIIKRNANGSSDDQRMMAKSLIAECDITLGLGTGASQDLKSAQKNRGSKQPILFTAVTDPVSAKLVKTAENTTGYVCGTSDEQPIDAQIALIKRCIPDADKIGIFYTISESNSDVQAKQAAAKIKELGCEAVVKTCTGPTDIATSIAALVSTEGLDAIYLPTDNNVASNMNYISTAVKNSHILVVCGEENMVAKGGHVSISVDYTNLGVITGEMAAEILNGDMKPSDFPVVKMEEEDCACVFSSANLAAAGVDLDEEALENFVDISEVL